MSDMAPVAGQLSTVSAVTPGCKMFQNFQELDTISKFNFTFSLRYVCGAAEANIINTVGLQ